nr:D-alanyl-D-alanine carboxypeptidase/D-alanyl-D-alanine-endopeptidase [Paenibacillus bovis]
MRPAKSSKYILLLFIVVCSVCIPISTEYNDAVIEAVNRNRDHIMYTLHPIKIQENSHIHRKVAGITEYNKSTLQEKLAVVLQDKRLDGALISLCIREANTGNILYSHNENIRLHPASNMKILTAVSAFKNLGPEYRFRTEVLMTGKIKKKALEGDIILKGQGDPTLMQADFERFAIELKEKGIHEVSGNIIADDTWYDDIRLSQDINWSDESVHYGAQVSALTLSPDMDYDSGTVIVELRPGKSVGDKAEVKVYPDTHYVTIINNTKTVAADASRKIEFEREHGTNTIVFNGTIPLKNKTSKNWVTVWEPTNYTAHVFRETLEENGISFSGKSKIILSKTPKNAKLLAMKESIPLKELIIPFMKMSNNGHGETLTKELGKVIHGEGSWEKGLQVIEDTMTGYGVDNANILLRDGSGMSHKNLIPASEISNLLFAIQSEDWFHLFEESLPIAGEPGKLVGGTLRYRMTAAPVKGNVRAKTGSLTGVSTLSGYVNTLSGEKLIFSIMINNFLSETMKNVEDEIVQLLVNYKE